MAIAVSKVNMTGEEVINYLLTTEGAYVVLPKSLKVTPSSDDQSSMNAGRMVTIRLNEENNTVRFIHEIDGDKPSEYEFSSSIPYNYKSREELGLRLKNSVNNFQVRDYSVVVQFARSKEMEDIVVLFPGEVCYDDIKDKYEDLRREYPDAWVNLTWDNNSSFIASPTYSSQLENAKETQW